MIAALLGALASVGGAALGADASSKAADYNYRMDLLNYYAREKERRQTYQTAQRQEEEAKLGSTDAQGNRTYFKPGVGWVVDASDETKQLQELYRNEELAQLQNDLPQRRERMNANDVRQDRENLQASSLFDAFQRVAREDPREVENQLNQAATQGITKGADDALQAAMQNSIRTGASNSGKVATALNEQRLNALRDAFMNNKLNARGMADERYDTQRGNLANLYNMFATRASTMPDVAYNPRNIEGMTGQQLAGNQGINQGAMGALINAFSKQGGSMARIEPDYGLANAVASGGAALSSAFERMGARNSRNAAMDDYGNYAGVDSSMYKKGTGLW